VGRARGLTGAELRKRKEWVIENTQISGVWKHIVSELSLGYRQRVGLAQALIHDPRVVILDEPTSGLDPMQIVGIRKLIRELAKNKTVIFSTHILQEASAVSDRLLIIDRGRIIAHGTVAELKKSKAVEHTFTVGIQAGREEVEDAFKSIPALRKAEFLDVISGSARFLCSAGSYDDAARSINRLVKEKNWYLRELSLREPSLEEIFLGLFKDTGKEK
ncbi:MAG: ATP-binding cassette domain-containing protein, partial [Candidatus Omnitrophota bacterium]